MALMAHTRDYLLQTVDISPADDPRAFRVTIVEMIGERGHLERRLGAARALAKRAVNVHNGRTSIRDGVHFCGGQGRVTIEVTPA